MRYVSSLIVFLLASFAFAASEAPQTFTLDGRLYADSAGTTPLTDTDVDLVFQILDNSQTCILYEETRTNFNAGASNGFFAFQIGSTTGDTKRSGGDNGLTMKQVYSNIPQAGLQGKLLSNPATLCAHTPSAGDQRHLRVQVTPSSDNVTRILSPFMAIDSVPNAVVAEHAESAGALGTLAPADVLQVNTSSGYQLSQSNLNSIFTTSNFSALTQLLAGTSGLYSKPAANGTTVLPNLAAPSSPSAGQVWYNAGNILYHDGSTTRTISTGSSTSVSAGNGTAGAPSLSFSGDTDTGWYLAAPDTLAAATAGAERVRIDADGNLGVGSTAAGARLTLGGNATATAWTSAGIGIRQNSTTYTDSTSSGTVGFNYVNAFGIPTLAASSATTYANASSFSLYPPVPGTNTTITNSTGLTINSSTLTGVTNGYGLQVNASTGATNNYAASFMGGNVGIGTTAPTAALTVAGNISADGDLTRHIGSSTLRYNTVWANNVHSGGTSLVLSSSTGNVNVAPGGTVKVKFESGGNVGIGTTTPTAFLQIKAGAAAAGSAPLKFTTGTNLTTPEDGAMEYSSGALYFTVGSTRYTIPLNGSTGSYTNVSNISNSAGDITMSPVATTGAVRIDSGTTSINSMSGALVVTGGVGVSGAVNAGGAINAGTTLSAGTNAFIPQIYGSALASGVLRLDGTSNATKGDIYMNASGGNVGIGTTAPGSKLEVQTASSPTAAALALNTTTGLITDSVVQTFNNGRGWIGYDGARNTVELGSGSAKDIVLSTNQISMGGAGERMRITQAGNVGIGTTAPGTTLDVNGTGYFGGKLRVGGNSFTTALIEVTKAQNTGYSPTAMPQFALSANNTNSANFNAALIGFLTRSSTGSNQYSWMGPVSPSGDSPDLVFGMVDGVGGSLERMRIQGTTGNVGIGTTVPTAALHLKAGTATAGTAPLKLTAGPVNTTAEAGAIEFDGTNLYYTNASNARQTLATAAGGSFSNVTSISNSGGNILMSPAATTGAVTIDSGTTSTSSTTGALIVTGGAGVSGNIFAGGTVNAGTTLTAGTSAFIPQIYGGATAAADIKIDGTSDATKGHVLLATAGGNVGIGTTSPGATTKLNIAADYTNEATAGGIFTRTRMTPTANTAAGGQVFYGDLSLNSAFNFTGQQTSHTARVINSSTGTVTGATAGDFVVSHRTAGTITQATGLASTVGNQTGGGTGTIGTAKAISAELINTASGTINTGYGVYVAPAPSVGTLSDYYSIYSNGGKSYFAGNVGIGTTAPVSNLQISAANPIQYITNTSSAQWSSSRLYLNNSEVDGTGGIFYFMNEKLSAGAATGATDFQFRVTNAGGDRTDLMYIDSVSRNIVFNSSKSGTGWWGNVLIPNGNVGIGTTAPGSQLHISSGAGAATGLQVQNTSAAAASSANIQLRNDSNNLFNISVFSSGNAGTGATQASAGVLQANGSGGLNIAANDAAGVIRAYTGGSTAGNERMRIDSSGNVGIGTTAPTAALHLKAGTATAGTAPLKLTAGPVNTTPEAGAIEFDGTNLYYTNASNARQTISTGGGAGDFMADGTVPMTNQLQGVIGSAAAPSFTFDTDEDTGIYRSASGQIGFASNGSLVLKVLGNANDAYISNGLAKFENGSAASPAFSFENDNDTGMFVGVDNNLAFATGGSEAMRIVSGKVGIGTTLPGAPLSVLSTSTVATSNPENGVEFTKNWNVADSNQKINLRVNSSANHGGTSATNWSVSSYIYNQSATIGDVSHFRGETNVASGSITSLRGLHIIDAVGAGTVGSQYGVYVEPMTKGSTNNYAIYADGTSAKSYFAGNVGIGTTAPNSIFEVAESSNSTSHLTGATMRVTNTDTTNQNYAAIRFSSLTTGALPMSPAAIGAKFTNHSSTPSGELFFATMNAGTNGERMRIDSSGNVGIGTTSPTEKLHVNGNVLATAFLYSSDERLKKDIEPLHESLQKILAIDTVHYNWRKPANEEEQKLQIGLIAQNVREYYPEAVHEDKEGWLRVNYSALIAPIISAIRELYETVTQSQQRIQKLEKDLSVIQQKNNELEERLNRMEKAIGETQSNAKGR